jgi:hypothetical protein
MAMVRPNGGWFSFSAQQLWPPPFWPVATFVRFGPGSGPGKAEPGNDLLLSGGLSCPGPENITCRVWEGPVSVAWRPRCLLLSLALVPIGMTGAGCSVEEEPAKPAAECSDAKVDEVLGHASVQDPDVVVNCSLTLTSTFSLTKRLVVQGEAGSGVTIDCNGATINGQGIPAVAGENASTRDMITVKSTGSGDARDPSWSRPTDVIIKNCIVIGSVRILGMQSIEEIKNSSFTSGHASRMRHIAPTRITLDNLTITALARNPVFFGVGVTDSSLVNSEIKGESSAVALYLDAESSGNLIKSNDIHAWTPREVLAVDSSEYNMIINNRFSALSNGGIYLYRNCGERGVVRHTTPSHNTIVNNVFYYDKYSPTFYSVNPSVYLGSRNGSPGYCDDDDAQTIGSGASNLDFAHDNVVAQNQIYKLPAALMIKQGRITDSPNYIDLNTTVTTPISRLAGCYVKGGYHKKFILDGESIEVFEDANGEPFNRGPYVCHDGELTQ